jgi:hypothetical protein
MDIISKTVPTVHQIDGIDILAAKMDLLMTCEVCSNVGHSEMIVLRQGKKTTSSTMATTTGSATTTTVQSRVELKDQLPVQ